MRLAFALFAAAVVGASTPTSDTCPSIQRGYDYPGNDLDNVQVSGSDQDKADACCKACTKEISCAGWVISGSKCYLKNKLDVDFSGNDITDFGVTGSPQEVTNKCCDACSKTANCVGFVTHDGLSGSDQAQTFACCDACVKTPSCLGFVLHEGKCSLKWVLRGKTELNGALSGQYTVSRPGRPACLA
ncbi:hypothetical protein SDRG_05726 [Saprolegnia diclina VS20]|uniref:Apple domain-containing protein n=1 Tax=Saprolegnia diclina (strain VS20) TaxID=1156394 RepID=T0S243_SAPDV|nr:hypothetical protein SDRG_05726 [Saprolegnia diclina VS20]EQC36897.1 hypothetical protein SDRG_05726 [Saprolegnia diclina VS20]|eukprot:XP_008609678.1 hypothetical protein SDRG_05726 [Saprolegnia diclina VS20]